jgi:hypothetical protein
MYQIDKTTNSITALSAKPFGALGFNERAHLQEWIAKCPECLGEELLIIAKEFDGFDETKERLDLLALDKQGGLVLIENKLDDSGRNVVWQSLKYASYCSSLSKSQIVEIYQNFLVKNGGGAAREKIEEFLCNEEDFESLILNPGIHQRVIMVAANFRKEVTSTVLWLLQHGIRLQCIRATAFDNGGQLFLNMEQIIPTPEAADFMIGVAEKEKEQQSTERTLVKRETRRTEFWGLTLAAFEKAGISLFSNVSAGRDNWLNAGSGFSGVRYTVIFGIKEARVELNLMREQAENKSIFDQLWMRKAEIESAFGAALDWKRLDHGIASRVTYGKAFDGTDKENWPEMIGWLTDHIKRLQRTFSPMIPMMAGWLKGAEPDNPTSFQEGGET